jgi:hypothetical protein
MEKLMNSTRPEASDSLGFARQSSWPEEPFDAVCCAGSMFTLFAPSKSRLRQKHAPTRGLLGLKIEVRDANLAGSMTSTSKITMPYHDAVRDFTTR